MRATKLLSSTKNLSYKDRLTTLNLPTLKYRRLRGDMIEMYKIITNKQDGDVTLKFNIIPAAITRGNIYKIRQDHVRHDLRKFSFSNRVRTLWNSLPDTVVEAESVNSFKGRLDRFWNDQEVKYNWKADIKPEAEVMYKFNLITLNFYTAVCHYTGHRGNSLRPFDPR